jgi:hypothetical protein
MTWRHPLGSGPQPVRLSPQEITVIGALCAIAAVITAIVFFGG